MKKKSKSKEILHCENPKCGKRISRGGNGRRKYCDNACKQKAYRLRRDKKTLTLATG